MSGRLFTPAEADRTLPLVRRIVADILERAGEMRELASAPQDPDAERRRRELERGLETCLRELRSIGCEYKDWGFDKGLVDFPARIDGRPVLLCWRSDEPRVAWYHAPDAGYAGRTPIPAELLGAVPRESAERGTP